MFDMTQFTEVKRLLEELAPLQDKLTPNELEMVRALKAKYDEPGHTSFDDKTCLEVILRNIKIRQGYGLEPGETAGRVIDLPKRPGAKKD